MQIEPIVPALLLDKISKESKVAAGAVVILLELEQL
jgi:hypothetical protein